MGLRPRTKRAMQVKKRRCPKCGKTMNRWRTRCKTCHGAVALVK